jgi:hypothetical protein
MSVLSLMSENGLASRLMIEEGGSPFAQIDLHAAAASDAGHVPISRAILQMEPPRFVNQEK